MPQEIDRALNFCLHILRRFDLDRFHAYLSTRADDKYAGAFPVWLAPVQVQIIPIADRHLDYAARVRQILLDSGFRTEVDARADRMQARIRDAQNLKIPYMLVVGEREAASETVSLRLRSGETVGACHWMRFWPG